MGYMRHHTIIVTGIDFSSIGSGDPIGEAHSYAAQLFRWVSPLSPEMVNGYRSFFIPPDGSKEGWDESYEGDRKRKEFISWMEERKELGMWVDWVEVQFGDDEGMTLIVRHSDGDKNDPTG